MGYVQLLAENELLALLVISFLGLAIGQTKIFGFKLGVAAVLFVGFILTTIEPEVQTSPSIYIVGLTLFAYTIELEAGPELFSSLRSCSIKYSLLDIGVLVVVTIEPFLLIRFLPIDPMKGAGAFTGALTNTPVMAAIVDVLPSLISDKGELATTHDILVTGYSLAYPIGMLVVVASIDIMSKVLHVDHGQEATDAGIATLPLHTRDTKVLKEDLPSITDLPSKLGLDVTVSRTEHRGYPYILSPGDTVSIGDIASVIGAEEEVVRAFEHIGELIPGDPTHDGRLDSHHIFVSAPDVVGVPIAELQARMGGMTIMRIRRDDHNIVMEPSMRPELGDRVCMAATSEKIKDATKFLGDSHKKFSGVNLSPSTSGPTLGILAGLIRILFPGDSSLAPGSAGGPLVVVLILGAVGRTGPLVWPTPYSANLALHTMGPALFLAGIDTTAGKGFQAALSDPASLTVLSLAAVIAFSSALLTLIVGHRVLKTPFGQTTGILSGLQTHPAMFPYVDDQAKNELPVMGYTTVYSMAMIMKVILAQVLVVLVLQHLFVTALPVTEVLVETAVNPK